MVKCSFCKKSSSINSKRAFHRFPLNDTILLRKWLENMGVGNSWVPTKYTRLCSDHFTPECYDEDPVSQHRTLKTGTVPTIFAETIRQCTYCKILRVQANSEANRRAFHKFPISTPKTLEKWLCNMGLQDWYPTDESILCSDHFEESCYRLVRGYKVLRDGSVPSIFSAGNATECATNATEIVQERSPLRSSTEEEQLAEQTSDFNTTELTVAPPVFDEVAREFEPPKRSCDTSIICPNCNHKFGARLCCEHPNRKMPSIVEEDLSKRPRGECAAGTSEILDSINEAGHDMLQEEPVPETSVPLSPTVHASIGMKTPNSNEKRKLLSHDHRYWSSPSTVNQKMQALREGNKKLRKSLKLEKQRRNRMKKKITSLQEVVSELRRTRTLPENSLDCLDSIAETDVSEFLKRYLKNANNQVTGQATPQSKKRLFKPQRDKCKEKSIGPSREKYPPALREFALTLHFYSPKAYAFVRRKFCKALPDQSTLRGWYSAVDGEPGFTSESFDALRAKVTSSRDGKKTPIICSLMLDEIGIKKGITRAPNGKVRGYIDLGTDIEQSDTLHLAKDALVIMVVAADSNWKLPIGYFLIDGITADISSNILSQALTRLHDIGVKVMSVTLDGPPTHFALLNSLGATFKMPSTKPFFPHPASGEPVYVIFDACHMLKLFRNCLGDCKVLKDNEGRYIEWKYIKSLAELQQKEGLRAGNKLRLAHINYFKMKMKVRLAAQTLSSSVADSLEHCDKVLQLPCFKGCEGTVRFIRCIDRLFDFMNSRNPFGKGYKAPLRKENEHIWRKQILDELEYLSQIRDLTGMLMSNSRRYVPFVGMFTAVQSVIAIFDKYVKPVDAPLKYLLTYKLSQDHLELFFCAIRCCGGWSPNPTASHFVTAYKRLLIHHQVRASNGNVSELDSTLILNVSSAVSKTARVDRYDPTVYDEIANARVIKKYDLESNEDDKNNVAHDFVKFPWALPERLSDFSRNSVSYIAGYVIRKILKIINCEQCGVACIQDSLTVENTKRDLYLARLHAHMQTTATPSEKDISLVLQKNRGGLLVPSDSVVEICQISEKLFRQCLNANKGHPPREPNFLAVFCSKVLRELFQKTSRVFPELDDHNFDEDTEDLSSHVFRLTKEIIKGYVEIRMFSVTNLATEAETGMKIRHHLTRQIIWKSQ